jgi:hypothetical protein
MYLVTQRAYFVHLASMLVNGVSKVKTRLKAEDLPINLVWNCLIFYCLGEVPLVFFAVLAVEVL